jgi:two-component sensor histidine kinase/HAMP domain-containing protein
MSQKIVWRTTFWIWGLMVATIIVFVVYIVPFQKETLRDRMENESMDIAKSILHANNASLITEDYGMVVDHCTQLVSDSKSIMYVVITRNDGYSLVHLKNRWFETKYEGLWLPDTSKTNGKIIYSDLLKGEVFHKSYKIIFSGVVWGWIHIGLSLDNYNQSLSKIENNVTWLTIFMSLMGLALALLFAKKLTKPIRILDHTTKLIAGGDLSAKAIINTGDELQSLALSFNKMTDALKIARDELEERVKERTAALAETNYILRGEIIERKKIEESLNYSLAEKDVLLKEIHHRVKNNLQIVSSLLFLQSLNIKEEETVTILQDSQNRIKSMALVHEKLYQSNDLARIDFGEYIIKLSNYIYDTYKSNKITIEFDYDLEEIFMPIDTAVPLGLILNELLTNSFKYAFINETPYNRSLKYIRLRTRKCDDALILEVSDNGSGMPKNFILENSESLGLKLVKNLVNQLEGQLIIESVEGTKFTLSIKHN